MFREELNKKDAIILANIRENARESLTRMSRKTNIPVSTIYDKLKVYERTVIKKYTSIVDFSKIGYDSRINALVKAEYNKKEELMFSLLKDKKVNSVFKVNNGYDFMFEAIFKDMQEAEKFIENLEKEFNLERLEVTYILEDLKREEFLGNVKYTEMTFN